MARLLHEGADLHCDMVAAAFKFESVTFGPRPSNNHVNANSRMLQHGPLLGARGSRVSFPRVLISSALSQAVSASDVVGRSRTSRTGAVGGLGCHMVFSLLAIDPQDLKLVDAGVLWPHLGGSGITSHMFHSPRVMATSRG